MHLPVNGVEAFAGTVGKGIDADLETVVFIHGVGQDHTIWVLPSRYFANHGRNVLAVDLPGHGRSSGEPLQTVEAMADWVMALLDAVGVEEAAVVGHSMGSLVGLDAAARYPGRVRALAMIGVSVPLAVSDPLMGAAAEGSPDAHDMLTYWSYSARAQVGGSPTPGLWMVGGNLRLLESAGPDVIRAGLIACSKYDAGLERAAQVECPVLLLAGERDRMTPVRGAAEISETLPDLRTVIFPGAGHPVLAERSDQVLDELIGFV